MRTFFTTLLLTLIGGAIQAQHQIQYLPSNHNPLALSPNGLYITGLEYNGDDGQAFLLNTETLESENLSTHQLTYDFSIGYSVNSAGMVAGCFRNHDYKTKTGIPVTTAGIYKDGNWIELDGIETLDYLNFSNPEYEGSHAYGISEDGKIAVGCLSTNSTLTPCAWIYNEQTDKYIYTSYTLPPGSTQGRINAISADGSIAVGSYYQENGNKRPIYWTSPDSYVILPDISFGDANGISSDGKQIALEVTPENSHRLTGGIYNLEQNSLIATQGLEQEAYSTFDNIATNGYAVGSMFMAVTVKKALIYTPQTGSIPFYDFLRFFAPEILASLASDFGFNPEDDYLSDLRSISDDGKKMIGTGYVPFIFTIDEDAMPAIYNRPDNLTGNITGRNNITLSWQAPAAQEGATLTGYKIYKSDVVIGTVGANQLSYSFEEASSGNIKYTVAATYEEGESFKSEPYILHIVATYDLPLIEDFDAADLSINSWTTSDSNSNSAYWANSDSRGGIDGLTATLYINATGEEYTSTLTSRLLDALDTKTVYLSYLYSYGVTIQNKDAVPDTMRVELYNGSRWVTIKEYTTETQYQEWTLENIDVSEIIAGTMARLRFRGNGKSLNPVMFDIENVRITANKDLDVDAAPLDLFAGGGEDRVILAWRNPDGVYDLTYAQTAYPNAQSSVGNEGKPLIAVNYYQGYELERLYQGEYLSAISACIRDLIEDKRTPTELALVVYLDNERVVNQSIPYFTPNAWNTFQLDTPLLIDGTKDLKFGLEVIAHDAQETPIGLDHSNNPIKGKGDLYSEDGGVTWKKISDEVMEGNPTYFQANWYIIGHLTATNSEIVVRDELTPAGYTVYRNGEKLNKEMVYATSYTGYVPTSIGDCFSVNAYYYDGTQSVLSPDFCLTALSVENSTTEKVSVYPNPANEYIYVNGEFTKLTLIGINGQTVLETQQHPIKINHLQDGIYFLKIQNQKEVTTEKVMIRK